MEKPLIPSTIPEKDGQPSPARSALTKALECQAWNHGDDDCCRQKKVRDLSAKQRNHNYIVRTQFNIDFCLNTGCERLVREGVHMCHLQEAATRRLVNTLSLGIFCPAIISYLTWHRLETSSDPVLPREALKSDGKALHQRTALLDWANGLLWAGRLWEDPGAIKVTAPHSLGDFRLELFETSLLGVFWLGLLWVLSFGGFFESGGLLSLVVFFGSSLLRCASCHGSSLFFGSPGLAGPCWPLLALTHSSLTLSLGTWQHSSWPLSFVCSLGPAWLPRPSPFWFSDTILCQLT